VLSSGATTGERCSCGAPIYAYHRSVHTYSLAFDFPRTADGQVDVAAIPMCWVFVCEAGHWQAEPEQPAEQLSLFEVMT
jgi:hypothetical protein